MKKKSLVILAIVLSLALSLATATAFAGPSQNDVKVVLDGTEMSFDVAPIIENGRTLVPFRAIFEDLGCDVDYYVDDNGQHVSAVKKHKEINLIIGQKQMSVNGELVTLDVAPKIVDDRTLIPLRAVAEALGAKVDWINDTRTVTIDSVLPLEGHNVIESHGYPYQVTDGMEDGIYNAWIYPSTIRTDAEGNKVVDVRYYCEDVYDIVDIALMSEGDTIEYMGNYYLIESIDRSMDGLIDINGGYFSDNEDGISLITYEDSNAWFTITTDIYPAYFPVGEIQTVVIAEDLQLIDSLSGEPGDDPKIADYSNFEKYMQENYAESWNYLSTTIAVEMWQIHEISRIWIP